MSNLFDLCRAQPILPFMEVVVGVEGNIVLEDCFQKVQERTLARIAFLRHQQQYGQLLDRSHVEQLQIVHAQLVLFAEDVPHKRLDVRERPLVGNVVDRFIEVEKVVNLLTVVGVARHGAEAVVLGNVGNEILAVVLAQCLDAPRNAFAHRSAAQLQLVHHLIVGRTYAHGVPEGN